MLSVVLLNGHYDILIMSLLITTVLIMTKFDTSDIAYNRFYSLMALLLTINKNIYVAIINV
jgi:hypothetical protein